MSLIGEHIYATRDQYLNSPIGGKGVAALQAKHREITNKVHKQDLTQKCQQLETQINNLFYNGGTTTADGNFVTTEQLQRVVNQVFSTKYPGAVINYSNLHIAKTRDLSKYSTEVQKAAQTLSNNLNKKNRYIKMSTLQNRLNSLAVLIKEFGQGNSEITNAFKAIQLEVDAIGITLQQTPKSKQGLSTDNSQTRAIRQAFDNLAQQQNAEIVALGQKFRQASTGADRVNNLNEQIKKLKDTMLGLPSSSSIVGDVFEYMLKASGLLIDGKAEQETAKAIEAGVEGAKRSIPVYSASYLSPKSTVTFNNANFGKINNLPDSSFSGGNDKFYVAISQSLGGTQDKIDVAISYENDKLDISAKNYNLWSLLNKQKGFLKVQDSSSLWSYVQNEDSGDFFVDHFVNLTMAQVQSQLDFDTQANDNASPLAYLVVEKIVFWKALTGKGLLKQYSDSIRNMDGANVFAFNNNQGGNGTGQVKITPMSTIFSNVFQDTDRLLQITNFPIKEGYWSWNNRPKHTDNPDLLNPDNRKIFADAALSTLANLKIHVAFNIQAAL